eukprot:5994291-Pyramimonas_sp.AAC.1
MGSRGLATAPRWPTRALSICVRSLAMCARSVALGMCAQPSPETSSHNGEIGTAGPIIFTCSKG